MRTARISSVACVLTLLLAGALSAQAPLILDVEAEVVSVDTADQMISFSDDTGTPYEGKVDEKTKMKAKKKVFKGKLTLEELKKGDKIKVRLDPGESRLLEVELVGRAAA